MKDYVELSLENHLFFDRIMKEHSLFLETGFLRNDTGYIKRAAYFRIQFERQLEEAVQLSNGRISRQVLNSEEIVTDFTLPAENKTVMYTDIPINRQITMQERRLVSRGSGCGGRNIDKQIYMLNQRSLRLVGELICFKEEVLREVSGCRLFTGNYPLLIEHIIREANLYKTLLSELETKGTITPECIYETEAFWNQIMMEHALFIRGLLDPSEEDLIAAANGFAKDYKELLKQAKQRDCQTYDELTQKTLMETEKYRDFKAAGTKGITSCEISSIILPLLADHVLREANHYLRILETSEASHKPQKSCN